MTASGRVFLSLVSVKKEPPRGMTRVAALLFKKGDDWLAAC